MIFIQNALVHDAIHRQPYHANILIEGTKIQNIGQDITPPEDCQILDATDLLVFPGFIDAHCHIGLDGSAIGYEGKDYNEYNDPITPHLRAIDGINPRDVSLQYALEGGVTCVATGPGSSNPIGGCYTAIKTHGIRVDSMIVKETIAMKCAFGENPKRVYKEKGISSRMTNAAMIRETLYKAKQYLAKKQAAGADPLKQPTYDAKMEALIPVLQKEFPLKAHAHQANDIFTALRIAKEFDLHLTLEHVTEGHLIAQELAKEQVPLAVGPTLGHPTKYELQNKSWQTPAILTQAGCTVSIITDSPVIPQQHLTLCAALAIKAGMQPFDALQAITINPAKHLGIQDRVGSIEIGKDADIVITNGSPFVIDTTIRYILCDGKLVHQSE